MVDQQELGSLVKFLVSVFGKARSLRNFARQMPDGEELEPSLAWDGSMAQVAHDFVDALARRRMLDVDFFALLEEDVPARRAEIAMLRQRFIGPDSEAGGPPSSGLDQPPRRPKTPMKLLVNLFRSLFTDPATLQQCLARVPGGYSVLRDLPREGTLEDFSVAAAELVTRRLDVFDVLGRLANEFPRRRDEIVRVAQFLREPTAGEVPPPASDVAPGAVAAAPSQAFMQLLKESTPITPPLSFAKVNFCVREREGGPDPKLPFPQVVLMFEDDWNDFGFRTRYQSTLFLSPEVKVDLDKVKIMRIGDEETGNQLPFSFESLDVNFCCLGSEFWYRSLSEHPEVARVIVDSLGDRAMQTSALPPDIQSDVVFRRSLMRFGTHERTWQEVIEHASPLRRALGLPLNVPQDAEPEPQQQTSGDETDQAPRAGASARRAAAEPGATPPAPMQPSSASPNAVVRTVPAQAWDGKTITLTISNGRAELRRGFGANACEVVWEAPFAVDWNQLHFVDAAGTAHSLAAALTFLPRLWSRKEVETFGDTLAKLLFGDDGQTEAVRELLVLPSGEQRRLVLDLDEASYRAPWEYLRLDPIFLAEQRFSIVRHISALVDRPGGLRIAPPEIVLFAYANPGTGGAPIFNGDSHRKQICEEFRQFPATLDPAEQCTAADLESLLLRKGQVFHFLGHGEQGGRHSEASLIVHAPNGETGKCKADQIARWMRDRRRDLAVLGACHSGAAPEGGIMSGIGARITAVSGTPVVAMQMAVPQDFSTAFVARFYRELRAADFDVEVAVYMARRAEHEGWCAFGIPVLLADARALETTLELKDLGPPGWARFEVRVVLTKAEASGAWGASTVVPRAAHAAVMRALAEASPEAMFPPPPARPEELRTALAQMQQALPEDRAQEVLKAMVGSAPTLTPRPGESAAIETLDDVALRDRITRDRYQEAIAEVEQGLSLPPGLVATVLSELLAEKHVLLTGPVGTGKTSLAQRVVKALGYAANLETASADWTRFEVQGGFWPAPADDSSRLKFEFRPGVFVEAVLQNWFDEPQSGGPRTWRRVARSDGRAGTWLIFDELNRADMDRALGGIFTALETRKLRVPVNGGTLELPIPADFRVIATINGADRHFLFRLSDALKRRFAFVHVPVTTTWEAEWAQIIASEAASDLPNTDDLRRFVALVRVLHPLGTALLQTALRFLATAHRFEGKDQPDRHLAQAIAGSILPNLEDLRRESLLVLDAWVTSTDPRRLAELLRQALPPSLTTIAPTLLALEVAQSEASALFNGGTDRPPFDKASEMAEWVARRVVRPADSVELPELARVLAELVSHAPLA